MKELIELICESFFTLLLNKMRTGLAILGIVIGIGSVIALVSLGEATQKSVQNQIQSLGANTLTVTPSSQVSNGVRGSGGVTTLTYEDALAISTAPTITAIKYVSPQYSSRAQVVVGGNNTNTTIMGITPVYAQVSNITMTSGSFLTDRDITGITKVAVLGPTVVSDLFGSGANPVGSVIRISGQEFTVIGVTKEKGGNSFQSPDDMIFVPISTAQKQLFGVKNVNSITLEAKNENVMIQAQDEVGYFLLARHKISDATKADFTIRSQKDILDTVTSITGTLTTMLTGVAAISLLVGGIGIMNIMLVTVTERTREIGLRKALGAKKKTITTQFLVESVILTFTGGVIGVLGGVGAYYLYTRVTNSLFLVSYSAVLIAFAVSAVIGIVFGWYPAKKASDLQPIEALRYE